MLSKLFTTARALLDSGPQAEISTTSTDAMVRTRVQSGRLANDGGGDTEDTIAVETLPSPMKRQRMSSGSSLELGENDAAGSSTTKKKKALPVRAKDDESPTRITRPVVEILVGRSGVHFGRQAVTSSKQAREESLEAKEAEGIPDVKAHQSRLEIPNSESDNDQFEIPQGDNVPGTTSTVQVKLKKDTSNNPKAIPNSSKAQHKRFGSNEPEENTIPTVVEIAESGEDSSDDDAPEVVGAHEALEGARSKEREATKAIEERESALRKKRKDRDAVLKQQAGLAKKRKREETTIAAIKEPTSAEIIPATIDSDQHIDRATVPVLKLPLGKALPDFLPEEYLEDEGREDSMSLEPEQLARKPKKTRFAELIEKKPKAHRKGSTTYRVSEASNVELAPKSSFQARLVKESWLQGRSGASRKPISGGFFKAK